MIAARLTTPSDPRTSAAPHRAAQRDRRRVVDSLSQVDRTAARTRGTTWTRPRPGAAAPPDDGRRSPAAACGRAHTFLDKAMREAKRSTSWLDPDERFEQAAHGFVDALYADERVPGGADATSPRRSQAPAWIASLSQLLLKATMPGVPDFYQGSELWTDSLVDPTTAGPSTTAFASVCCAPCRRSMPGARRIGRVEAVAHESRAGRASRRETPRSPDRRRRTRRSRFEGGRPGGDRVRSWRRRGRGRTRASGGGGPSRMGRHVDRPPRGTWRNVLGSARRRRGFASPWRPRPAPSSRPARPAVVMSDTHADGAEADRRVGTDRIARRPGDRRPARRDGRRRRRVVVAARCSGTGTRYRFVVDGDALPDPRSPCSARRPRGPVADRRPHRDSSGPTTGWAGFPLAAAVDLRAARRHVHAGGDVRRGDRQARRARRPGRQRHRDDAGRDVPRPPGLGVRRRQPVRRRTRPMAGPDGLKRFVDACHARRLAVVLDVVYNHLGPVGNSLSRFGPYFTDAYHTPWGEAVNLDGPGSDEVRRFVIDNALQWVRRLPRRRRSGSTPCTRCTTRRPCTSSRSSADEVHAAGRRQGSHGVGHRRERPQRPAARALERGPRVRARRGVERRLPSRPARRR